MIAITSHTCMVTARLVSSYMAIHLLGDADGNTYRHRLFALLFGT